MLLFVLWFGLDTKKQAREMEMTAEQFETLQMYNQMKKEKVVEPDDDTQVGR